MKILVPLDFTPTTENALKYSIGLTSTLNVTNIILFNVVNSEKESTDALAKLNQLIDKYKGTSKATLESLVRPGNIFDQIGSTAESVKASLIVMATHGIKGMQKIIGSKAMKVITQSKTPYIVIQNLPYAEIKKILIPVDQTREVKQMLPLIEKLNEKFKAEIILTKQKSNDEFISKQINNNLIYFKGYLRDSNIPHSEAGSYALKEKYKEVLAQAESSGADMIVTTIDPETGIADYIMGVEEQKLVANESQIPVLCVNIKHFMKSGGGFFESIG